MLLPGTRHCHDDREDRGWTVQRFIRATPATQSRAMAGVVRCMPSGANIHRDIVEALGQSGRLHGQVLAHRDGNPYPLACQRSG